MSTFFIGMIILRVLIPIFFVLLAVKIILTIANKIHKKHRHFFKGQAIHLLRRRYALGEIDAREYKERLETLQEPYDDKCDVVMT